MTDTSEARRGVIKSERPGAMPFNGVACLVLRDITEADGPAFNDKTPQVLALVDGREHYFYADEVEIGDEAADNAKVRPENLSDRLMRPATADQAAWDAAERQSNLQGYEQYLLAYPLGTHAAEARMRRQQVAPGLPPLPPLPQAAQDIMAAQAPVVAKDEERNVPQNPNHPEYDLYRGAPKPGEDQGRSIPGRQPAADDEAGWKAASDMNTVVSLDDYVAKFPNGAHVDEAKRRRDTLTG